MSSAATLPGLHLVEQFLASIDHTDAVGPVDLMTAEHEEVGTQLLHIDRRMGYGLCPVDEHRDVVRVGDVDDAPHVVDGAEGVVDMSHTDKLGAGRDEPFQFREDEVAIAVGRDGAQGGTPLLGNPLPWHNVGMMVEFGDDDLVAGSQELSSVGLCHEVDALGGASHEDDLLARSGIDEPLHLLACLLVGIGCTSREGVGATMDIRVIVLVIVRNLVDDLDRFLRGGTIVQPDQVVTVHLLGEHGEVALDLLRVQRVGLFIVEVAQFLRLRDADAETILVRNGLRLCICISEVRKFAIAAASSQKLSEASFQLREVQLFVRQYRLPFSLQFLRAVSLSDFLQHSQRSAVLCRKTI